MDAARCSTVLATTGGSEAEPTSGFVTGCCGEGPDSASVALAGDGTAAAGGVESELVDDELVDDDGSVGLADSATAR